MRITLIRHGKVNMEWPKHCTSAEYDSAVAQYDVSDLVPVTVASLDIPAGPIYVSGLKRSSDTAKLFFPDTTDTDYIVLTEIAEVPLASYKDCSRPKPLWIWNVMARLQWAVNNPRQEEGIRQTMNRANYVIDLCEKQQKDCVLVSHGFYLKSLLHVLKKRGYRIEDNNKFVIQNLQIISAVSK